MKKLDIMNNIEPGRWAVVGDKVQRIEEFVKEPLVVEKEEKEKVEEVVKEVIKEVKEKKPKKKKWGKK